MKKLVYEGGANTNNGFRHAANVKEYRLFSTVVKIDRGAMSTINEVNELISN